MLMCHTIHKDVVSKGSKARHYIYVVIKLLFSSMISLISADKGSDAERVFHISVVAYPIPVMKNSQKIVKYMFKEGGTLC